MSEEMNNVVPNVAAPEIGTGTSVQGDAEQQQIPDSGKSGFIGAVLTHGMASALSFQAGRAYERHTQHKEVKQQKKDEKAAKPKKRLRFQAPFKVDTYVEVPAKEVEKGDTQKTTEAE